MNYQKKFGITLKKAKDISRRSIGRLPRPGYQVLVFQYVDGQVKTLGGLTFDLVINVFLVNIGSKYVLESVKTFE